MGGEKNLMLVNSHLLVIFLCVLFCKLFIFRIEHIGVIVLFFLMLICLISTAVTLFRRKFNIAQKKAAISLTILIVITILSPINILYESVRFNILKSVYTTCAKEIAGKIKEGDNEMTVIGEYVLDFPMSLLPRGRGIVNYMYNGENVAISFLAFNNLNDWASYVYLSDGCAEEWLRTNYDLIYTESNYVMNCYSYEPKGDNWYYVIWG